MLRKKTKLVLIKEINDAYLIKKSIIDKYSSIIRSFVSFDVWVAIIMMRFRFLYDNTVDLAIQIRNEMEE